MKYKLTSIVLSVLFLIGTAAGVSGQKKCLPFHSLDEKNLSTKGGERLDLVFHYKWGVINADVARGYLSTDETTLNGRRVFKSRIFGQTARFYDNFFKVREDFTSWFAVDGLEPVRFKRDTRESKYYCINEYTFDTKSPNPHINAVVETSRKPQFQTEIALTDCLYDLPRVFFMVRNLDRSKLKIGQSYPVSFAIDDKTMTFNFIYRGKEVKNISGIGKVNSLKFGVWVESGRVFSGDDMSIWFSDDANMLPLMFQAPIKVGYVEGRLDSYQNLKHPFSSLVE